eukprot:gene7937-8792_t
MSNPPEQQDQQARQANQGPACGIIKWDPTYVTKRWDGRLKLAEIVITFLAGVCLPNTAYKHTGAFSFFSFVAWTSFINCMIDMFLHLTSLWDRILYICRAPEVYMVLCAIASAMFLLASSIVAAFVNHSTNSDAASASAFFGFVGMVLFGIEAYLHYTTYRRGRRDNVRQDEPDEFAEPI